MIAVEWKENEKTWSYTRKKIVTWIYVSLSKLKDAPRFRGRRQEFEATQEEAEERATAQRTTARKDASRNTSFEAAGRKLPTYRIFASEEEQQHSRRKPKDVRSKQKQKDTPLKKSLEAKSAKTSPEQTGQNRSDLPRLREQMRATELEGEAKQSATKERAHTEGDAPRKNSLESARRGETRRLPLARTAEKRKDEKRAKTKTKRKRREAIERTIGEALRGTR